MRRILLTFCIIMLATSWMNAQTSEMGLMATEFTQNPKSNYRLYMVKDMYRLIKLDTRTGQTEMIQWSPAPFDAEQEKVFINTYRERKRFPMSNKKLISKPEDAKPGRFTLHATSNMFNFILVDQIDGRVWQVQWDDNMTHVYVERF